MAWGLLGLNLTNQAFESIVIQYLINHTFNLNFTVIQLDLL